MAQPLHVLIVDDVTSCRLLLAHQIQQQFGAGAVITQAENGVAACSEIERAKADRAPLFERGVVLLDKEMPECDGLSAAKLMRSLGFRGLIVGVTGTSSADDVRAFEDAGADQIFMKPIQSSALFDQISSFIAK